MRKKQLHIEVESKISVKRSGLARLWSNLQVLPSTVIRTTHTTRNRPDVCWHFMIFLSTSNIFVIFGLRDAFHAAL